MKIIFHKYISHLDDLRSPSRPSWLATSTLPAANVPRVSWPCATSGNPNRGWACRGSSRQGARPRRRGRRGENPLHLVDPAEVGAADVAYSPKRGAARLTFHRAGYANIQAPYPTTMQERLGAEPHTRLRFFCSPYHQDSALYPAIAQLERAAGFRREDTLVTRNSSCRSRGDVVTLPAVRLPFGHPTAPTTAPPDCPAGPSGLR